MTITKKLEHKNIVEVFEINYKSSADTNIAYIAMEYLPGKSLNSIIKNNNLNIYQKINIAQQIINGLQYMHNQDCVHNDLSSKNIIVNLNDKNLRTKIIDLGLSKTGSRNNSETDKNNKGFRGTVLYASPEAFGISKKSISRHKTDIWSLGVILYEFIYGKHPYYKTNQTLDDVKKDLQKINKLQQHIRKNIPQNELPDALNKKLWKQIFSQIFVFQSKRNISLKEIQNKLQTIYEIKKNQKKFSHITKIYETMSRKFNIKKYIENNKIQKTDCKNKETQSKKK